jgi:hypothetical protein
MAKYDLHTHLFTTWEQGNLSLERAPRNPDYLLDAVKAMGLDGIALANFCDTRFEQFADSASQAVRYKLAKKLLNALIFEHREGQIKIIGAEETSTDKGHLLIIGKDYGSRIIPRSSLTSIDSRGASKIADHFWDKHIGIGKTNLIELSSYFTAFERANSNFGNLSDEEVKELEKTTGLFSISTSDSHNRRDLGNAYIETSQDFDFSSEENLRGSIEQTLKQRKFIPHFVRMNPYLSRLGHLFLVSYDVKIRRPLKLL